MNKRIIVMVGDHGMIHDAAKLLIAKLSPRLAYYTSLSDELWRQSGFRLWERNDTLDAMIMSREFERDGVIFNESPDYQSQITVIEQWHLGNIAFARARGAECAHEYLTLFEKEIHKLENVSFQLVYVSMDLDKAITEEFKAFYDRYLTELENLREYLKLSMNYMAGDAPTSLIEKRLSFLLL